MKIAVLSDARLPTRRDFAGHGLGQVCITIAEGLAERGHGVNLWGAPGSKFSGGGVHIWRDEADCDIDAESFDVILDSTHRHLLQRKLPEAKIVNLSQDREGAPGRCAVYSSEQHRDWLIQRGAKRTGRVVHNGIAPQQPHFIVAPGEHYYLYMATFYAPKGPAGAANAARLAGARLVMAGPTNGIVPPAGTDYIGPMAGEDKFDLLRRAKALIFPSAIECSPVTVLEALSVGTPVICSAYGGATSNMLHGETGFACRDTLEMVEAIGKMEAMPDGDYLALRARCIQWVTENRGVPKMMDGYEAALNDAAAGQVW